MTATSNFRIAWAWGGTVEVSGWYGVPADSSIGQRIADASTANALFARETTPRITPIPGSHVGELYPLGVLAQLTFLADNGTLVVINIPAPASVIFMADGFTVNPAHALVAPLIAAFIANGSSRDGSRIASYRSGRRKQVGLPPPTRG